MALCTVKCFFTLCFYSGVILHCVSLLLLSTIITSFAIQDNVEEVKDKVTEMAAMIKALQRSHRHLHETVQDV